MQHTLDAKNIQQFSPKLKNFWFDFEESQLRSTMAVKVTPLIGSLIDGNDLSQCPVRKQFIPLQSSYEADHPMLKFESLNEQADSSVSGLVHRYYLDNFNMPNLLSFLYTKLSDWHEHQKITEQNQIYPWKISFWNHS